MLRLAYAARTHAGQLLAWSVGGQGELFSAMHEAAASRLVQRCKPSPEDSRSHYILHHATSTGQHRGPPPLVRNEPYQGPTNQPKQRIEVLHGLLSTVAVRLTNRNSRPHLDTAFESARGSVANTE